MEREDAQRNFSIEHELFSLLLDLGPLKSHPYNANTFWVVVQAQCCSQSIVILAEDVSVS